MCATSWARTIGTKVDEPAGEFADLPVYPTLAVRLEGNKEPLGMWIEQSEGAKFWLNVMNELMPKKGLRDPIGLRMLPLARFKEAGIPGDDLSTAHHRALLWPAR